MHSKGELAHRSRYRWSRSPRCQGLDHCPEKTPDAASMPWASTSAKDRLPECPSTVAPAAPNIETIAPAASQTQKSPPGECQTGVLEYQISKKAGCGDRI
jgi:hypothetical protein